MATILLTGGSGFIGGHVAQRIGSRHRLVCISRSRQEGDGWIRGDFGAFEDLRQLDDTPLDAVIHLAAVTGGCIEREGMLVNVEGTRCLLRYAAERGCRRFVLASSIAVVGTQNADFMPTRLPITEDEPCVDRHGYGFSKHLMEEVAAYHVRQSPDSRVFSLRFGGVRPGAADVRPKEHGPPRSWWFNGFAVLSVKDVVQAVALALASDLDPGVHTYFIGPPRSATRTPVHELIERAFGADAADTAHYRQPGHELDAVFSIEAARRELGYEPVDLPDWMEAP
jgi:UDP-glucose 4-epimerase